MLNPLCVPLELENCQQLLSTCLVFVCMRSKECGGVMLRESLQVLAL